MVSPGENGNPTEEIEEGEIADASNDGFDDNDEENLPTLQRKASLNDLAASRYWNEPGRREDSPRFMDQGQTGGQWRREGLHYTTSNGSYNPDLYNLAWAQAVQSKPANTNNTNYNNNAKYKDEKLKTARGASRSENPRNGRKYVTSKNDDCINISSSSSDSVDSDDSVRVIKMLAPNSSGSGESSKKESCAGTVESKKKEMGRVTLCDNDEKLEVPGDGDDDEKEEGELEEGEIEVGSDNSDDAVVAKRYDNKTESVRTSKQGVNFDRGSARHTIGSKRSIDGKHGSKDQDRENREKMVAAIGQMLKNVTVKDAQKSFIGVCDQLRKALEHLIRMNMEVHSNSVSGIVKQIFSGIRATYAVYKTGSPKQQEQEKSAFPRLLEFVSTKARKHFTNKQIKELESMLGSVSSGNRSFKADTAQGEKGKQGVVATHSSMESTFKSEERQRISHNTNLTTQTSTKSVDHSNSSNEITNNSRKFEPNDDTQRLALTESDSRASSNSDSRASSNSSLCVGGAGSSDDTFKLWKEDTDELNDSNLPTPTRESSPADWNQQSLRCIVESQSSRKPSIPFGRGIQEETDESAFWASEPVNAVTYYQEKFGRKTFFSNNRLPSPTPSEDNEEEEASNQGLEVSSYVANTFPKQVTEDREMRPTGFDGNLSALSAKDCGPSVNSDVESRDVKPGIQTWSSGNLELPVFQSKDNMDAVELRRLINSTSVTSRKALAKSRDPRRRVTESDFCTVDLNTQPCQIESNVITKEQAEEVALNRKHKVDADIIEDCNHKRPRNHSPHHLFPTSFPVMMSGSGGWLEENTVIPSSSDWDQTLEMEVDSTGTVIRPIDLPSDYNSIADADREDPIIENGNLNKRLKTESFYQANVSESPAYGSNQLQSNTIDGNLGFTIQSQSEEERVGRLEVDITGQGQLMHDSVDSISTIIPSVLKDIAVNPTMLMSLLKNGQESLSAQAAQKTEQYQEKNPPSVPTGELMHTTGKEMAVDPSLLNVPDLQQQLSQELATSKPASQPTSTAGEVQKRQMKPRDPRRILPINSGCEDFKMNGTTKACVPISREIHMTSSRSAVDSTPKLSQVPSLPNIEQNFKEKLVHIAEMLGKSDMKTLQALSSQLCIDKSKKETDYLDSENSKLGRSSKFYETEGKQDMGDMNMVSSSSQGVPDESIANVQNKLHPWGDLDHFLEGYSEEQRLAIHQERARRIEEQNKMFHAKKLCLVLDLDHTLLNSAKFVEVDPVHEEILRKKEELDRERPYRHLFRFPYMGMWTKLRPGIWNFLDRASKLYELHVYTMGNKVYATEMAKLLDPTGTLFAGRVISKGDEADVDGDDRPPKSKDLDGVLGMESAVVIIDDSARVWPHHRHNLIVVERYMYFPCSRRQFGLAGQSLLEADVDERAEDGTLASSLAVIEKIHHNFFSSKLLHEVDVRDFLAAEQQKILMGCKVVFSRVFPVGEAQPHLHPLWQMAEQFGAVCTTQIDEQVTHVVALSPGTDKVNWAVQTGRWVVHPGWLEASALLYRRANENHYSIIMTHYPPQ